MGPPQEVVAPVLVIEKPGVGKGNEGLESGVGQRERFVHVAPRGHLHICVHCAHYTGDFPRSMEQNSTPFPGPTGQHHPDPSNLLGSLNTTRLLQHANLALTSGPLHVLFSQPRICFPRNPHCLYLLVSHISVPVSLPQDTPDYPL